MTTQEDVPDVGAWLAAELREVGIVDLAALRLAERECPCREAGI